MDENIAGIQVDAVALPDEDYLIYGDDIVILFSNGNKRFLQAKVNQTDHQYWKLTDTVLKKELISARDQLLVEADCDFHFYSRTPFNLLQRLIEEANLYPDYQSFLRVAPQRQKDTLSDLATLWENDQANAFALVKRIGIGDHHSSEGWQRLSLGLLHANFSQSETALKLIYNYVDRQHSKLGDPQFVIDRQVVIGMLERHGIYHVLGFNEKVVIEAFREFSLQGRQWVRTIGGAKIIRSELELLTDAVHRGVSSVLLEDIAGGGKTCILLDLMEYLDAQTDIATLFIKGDLFASIDSLNDLVESGLPPNFIAQSAHLAGKCRLVVIIDSLDVLAVGRSHKSLRCFLGLIASLSVVPNITLIAASRSFDAQYDPLLREASWAETVTVEPLSFNDDIAPLLIEWGVNPDEISATLKGLLLIPQNVRLFYVLIQRGMRLPDIEEHDLYELYIRELIENDEYLGAEVVEALQNIAVGLLAQRSYKFPRNLLGVNPQQLQRLLSQEVIAEVSPHQLMFSHQTLADALRIRQAQVNGVDLKRFVTSQPQLPFIRPAVRAFILTLRSNQPDQFTKQLRQFLLDDNISMHLKRLAIETLAEMAAREDDLAIISVLSSKLPTIFSRFLDRANGRDWFLLLHNHWLSTANISSLGDSVGVVLRYFSQFLDGYEEWIIAIWNRALDERWLPIDNLVWSISSDIRKLKKWDAPGVGLLLEKLLSANEGERDDVGRAICQYVDATGDGDELLWRYIIRDAEPIAEIRRGRELKLNCQRHDLLNEGYLENRLKQSDILFGCAMEYILQFSQGFVPEDDHYPFESNLLDATSYNQRHTNYDMLPHDSIHEFLDAVESAMKIRAQSNDPRWKEFETRLRVSRELGVRYLLCETYLFNIPDHIEGIEGQLIDSELLRYGHMEYELGMLASRAYPYISHTAQEQHQRLLIGLYDDLEDGYDWIERNIYQHLAWVPAIYRLPELNDFFGKCEKAYGAILPEPSIGASGGMVRSPVSSEKLIELNHITLIKLFRHYNEYDGWGVRLSEGLVGGRESLNGALSTAASWVPMHFVPLIPMIDRSSLSTSYIYSIIDGLASHLRCRFGNLSNSNWKAIDPLPEGNMLAKTVLDLVEQYCGDDYRGYTSSRAIEACGTVLDDDQSLERIYFQLWRLGLHPSPEPEKDEEAHSLINAGINSVRGTAAETLLMICNDRLDRGKPVTDELQQLLIRYAKDPSIVVRATFLRRFPYFHSKEADLGWRLVNLLVTSAKPRLIKHLERTLYYQYHSHFDSVKPYIELLKTVDDEKSSAAWGRLATLSFLSGHMDEDELWEGVHERNEAVVEGIGQVFVANLNCTKSSSVCIEGLSRLMQTDTSKSVFTEFERSLDNQDQIRFVPFSLIKLFIAKAPIEHVREIDSTFNWLEKNVASEPISILEVLEDLVERLSDLPSHIYFHRPDALLTTLKLLLQEADLSDDDDFIDRVLSVQDWFLNHGVTELEALLA
ncbi:hypothetical protein [Zhongshania sp. BJYM1]|uniref:hypothetical protein n=1 Tax=Zhongshania aquatica TaxID=2965069 RepID=UPI0022B5CDD1|nr:hypothetical protein [Marortus sp. BJYM1]